MSTLKENEEKRSRKEERENRRLQRARVLALYDSVVALPSAVERGIGRRKLVSAALRIEMSAAEVMDWQKFMESVDWQFMTGAQVHGGNFLRSLRMWHVRQVEIDARRRGTSAEREAEKRKAIAAKKEAERVKAAAEPGAWQLCRERCRYGLMCGACGAAPRHAIPPQLREHPIPPEDCKGYEPKEGGAE